ncbi:TIGR01244 family sulfur transferase [Abyssibius alkaniclasticus]|uniref:TIGR01244 family sulfur transferase n=1 Tax=Abyssibius alkaniclasticus TaxID=2881234 RepID=UPI004059C786|tara:strand:+ start:835 stop:1161 length:327 start_codon:yes stop_codon:yes gene_type:complete
MNLNKLSDTFSATGQLDVNDIAAVKAAGFGTVICNRPDGEEADQPTAAMIEAACADHGLAFHYVPMTPAGPGPTTVADFAAALNGASGNVLGYCKSGGRAAMLYKATR